VKISLPKGKKSSDRLKQLSGLIEEAGSKAATIKQMQKKLKISGYLIVDS
jgi:uncharacterized lipoprotein YehR (DUF1307 family)